MLGTEFLQVFALTGTSLAIFWVVGAELAFKFVVLWFLGMLVGGFLANETVWKLKTMSY